MSLVTNLQDAFTRVATELKSIRTLVNGNAAGLTALNTTAKTNLVAAINELYAASQSAAGINDATTSGTTTWSSTKTQAQINAAVAALVDSAPATIDTLNELAAALGDDPNFATTIANQIAGKANAVHTHAIADVTGLQTALNGKAASTHTHVIADVTGLQAALDAKANTVDVGSTTTNFVTTFEAGLV